MGNKMAYNATHGLKENRIKFTIVIDHKELPRERGHTMKNPSLLIHVQLSFQQI